MTDFVAVVSRGDSPRACTEELDRAVEAYRAVAGDRAEVIRLSRGPVIVALFLDSPAAEASTSTDSRWWVTTGTPYDRCGRPATEDTPLQDLDGQFSALVHDPREGVVTAVTDPLGMTPVYYAEQGDRVYVSTSSLALAVLLQAPADRCALQAFLLAGYHFGTVTHWHGIHRLDPGHALTVRPAGVKTECYWRPVFDEEVRALPLSSAVDHCVELATDAFKSRLAPQGLTWVDLTGGYDSRLLALLLSRAGVPIQANTRHTTNPDDVRIAHQVANLLRVPWFVPQLPRDWPDVLPSVLSLALASGDANLEVLQLARVLWSHQRLSGAASLLSGGGGEHFQYAAWKSEFARAGRSTQVNLDNWINMRMIKPVDASILRDDALPRVREDFRQRLTRWIDPYHDELNTAQLDLLYAYKSTGHFGAYRAADDALLRTQIPFYFRDVFQAAISTNHRHRNNHRLMRHMVQRLDPVVAALPTTRGGPAEPWRPGNAHRFSPYYLQLGRKAVTKLSDKMLGKPLLLQQGEFDWMPEANASVLRRVLPPGEVRPQELRSGVLYDPEALSALLRGASRPGFSEHALLGRLITVELALRTVGTAIE